MPDMRFAARLLGATIVMSLAGGCSAAADPPAAAPGDTAPADAQHQDVTGPHGDHTPKHGGFVLMNGDLHYEVVLAANGRHRVWFTDAMRNELPASLASHVTLTVNRPAAPAETLSLAIDESGESWLASGRPVAGDGVMVTISYAVMGEPVEIEVPFVPAAATPAAPPGS